MTRKRPTNRSPTGARTDPLLPERFEQWFRSRRWSIRPHQLAMLEKARARRSTLLIAPTGAGKTLAGFLPSLVALAGERPRRGRRPPHTLYLALKALAVDVARNLLTPDRGNGLPFRVETRTGDTSSRAKAAPARAPARHAADDARAGRAAALATRTRPTSSPDFGR